MADQTALHGGPSLWVQTSERTSYPRLADGSRFEVAIVGGGIVGVLVAHRLRGQGRRVALIEGRRVLEDVTGYTTGKLTSQHGMIYHHLIKSLGAEKARAYYEANQQGLADLRDAAARNLIDCDMTSETSGVVFCGDKAEEDAQKEADALSELDIPHEVVHSPHPRHGGAVQVLFPDQAHFHPRRLLLALLKECRDSGVEIYEDSRIEKIEERDEDCALHFSDGMAHARQVVVATCYPIHDSGFFVAKLAPYRSYAMAVRLREPVPKGMFITHGQENMRSTRPAMRNGESILIAGGEHHKVGQEPRSPYCYAELEGWVRSKFEVDEVVARWSTQDNWTPDDRPCIGRSPHRERIFVAIGFGGWGMTTGWVAAEILAAQISDEEHPWADLYDPGRLTAEMVPEMVSENWNVAKQIAKDTLTPGETLTAGQIEPGDARIVAGRQDRVAAYRDPAGHLHCVSAICPHMGCQVAWNEAEGSWDCPCHGSRFSPNGEVLQGPATVPLSPREID